MDQCIGTFLSWNRTVLNGELCQLVVILSAAVSASRPKFNSYMGCDIPSLVLRITTERAVHLLLADRRI